MLVMASAHVLLRHAAFLARGKLGLDASCTGVCGLVRGPCMMLLPAYESAVGFSLYVDIEILLGLLNNGQRGMPCRCSCACRLGCVLARKVHGSLARAGKVRGQTPKVPKQDKKKTPKGRALKRIKYNRRFVNVGEWLCGKHPVATS